MTIRLLTTGPFAGLPDGHFRTILADPPWTYKTFNGKPGIKAPPYPTMSLDEIKALPVADLAADGSWLFLWTTPCFLDFSRECMKAWGFRFSSVAFTWIKISRDGSIRRGLGKTTRKSSETVLLGKLGAPKILSRPDEVLLAMPRQHSRKPPEIMDRIEAFCPGPRIELFSRESRPNWTHWGLETGKFDEDLPDRKTPFLCGSSPLRKGRLERHDGQAHL
jgi:N6-adenosine-specific RNA methylase IME4